MKDLDQFITEYGESLKNGIMAEGCIEDFFDMILEMGASERRAINSQIARLYEHMLKYIYQPEKQTRSWINTIRNSLYELQSFYNDSKTFWNQTTDIELMRAYNLALDRASRETGLNKRIFASEPPMDWLDKNKLVDSNFIEDFLITNANSRYAKRELGLL